MHPHESAFICFSMVAIVSNVLSHRMKMHEDHADAMLRFREMTGSGILLCNKQCEMYGLCSSALFDTEHMRCYLNIRNSTDGEGVLERQGQGQGQGHAQGRVGVEGYKNSSCESTRCGIGEICLQNRQKQYVCVIAFHQTGMNTPSPTIIEALHWGTYCMRLLATVEPTTLVCMANGSRITCPKPTNLDNVGDSCSDTNVCRSTRTECHHGACQCKLTLVFRIADGRCVKRCVTFSKTMTMYPGTAINGHTFTSILAISLEECMRRCITTSKFLCISVDYGDLDYVFKKSTSCQLANVTANDVPAADVLTEETWTYAVRDCEL